MDETFPGIVTNRGGRGVPKLTRHKGVLAKLLWNHVDRCESQYMLRRTLWLISWYYLNGYRRFTGYDPTQGRVSAFYLDQDGNAEFQSQELLYRINRVVGRLMAIDAAPMVQRKGSSLGSIRSRAVSQVFADAMAAPLRVRQAQEQFSYLFTTLGFAGLCGHLVDHPTVGLSGDLEVIHPRELMPFPISSSDITKATSIMRVRYVPLDFVKERFGRKVSAHEQEMEIHDADPGEAWAEREDSETHPTLWESRGGSFPDATGGAGGGMDSDGRIPVVKFRELWLRDELGLVARYVASSGEYVMEDRDFDGGEVYCPVSYGRFFNNGSFYGSGMFDVLFSIVRQAEKMSKMLFSNVENLDRYGILVLPQGELPENQFLRDVGKGLRVATWAPDPIAEGQSPFVIQPHNAGDIPGRVAQFAKELIEDVDPIRNLIEEKGRVDSASGLQALDEQINQAMSTPTWGFQKAWGDMYMSLTHRALMESANSDRAIPVTSLTLDLAGAVIDFKTDTLRFAENPVPDISRLEFTLRETNPRSQTARKQEAVQFWRDGIETDPVAFRLALLREGMDVPLWLEDYRGAMESSIKIILMLYNDGETPGEVVLTPRTIKADLLLRLLESFMTGPHMQVASPQVIDEFQRAHEQCLVWTGMVLPAAVPNPDDAAALSGIHLGDGGPGGPGEMGGMGGMGRNMPPGQGMGSPQLMPPGGPGAGGEEGGPMGPPQQSPQQ